MRTRKLFKKASSGRIYAKSIDSNIPIPKPYALFAELLASPIDAISYDDDEARKWINSIKQAGVDLQWYHGWLREQILQMSLNLSILGLQDEKKENQQLRDGQQDIKRIFVQVSKLLYDCEAPTLDEIVQMTQEMLGLALDEENVRKLRYLVFAILGWQSMLYRPAFNVCSLDELAIVEDDENNSGFVFDAFRVSADLADQPLYILLKAFGNILPAPSLRLTTVASEGSKEVSSWVPLYPAEMNAYLLHQLLQIRIRWVDSLALHLDYDKTSRTLSLFRYPSFCVAMLQSKGAIYSFASTEQNSIDPRANEADILHFLEEVLLSFRLLFGQSPRSRKHFPRAHERQSYGQVDSLLPLLCMTKKLGNVSHLFPEDQPIYFANQHFPILSEKIEHIAKELRRAKPQPARDLFQFVSIIGGLSILLSLIQVILQGLQYSQS